MLKDFFVARQPILDKAENLWGFELLFRQDLSNNMAIIEDPDVATASIASSGFLRATSGIPAGLKIFINFTEELLIKRFPLALPAQTTVIEILEDIPISMELIESLKELKKEGYILALDDFTGDEAYNRIIQYIDIIKLDCFGRSIDDIINIKNKFSDSSCLFLAEKVESESVVTALKEHGVALFQGYYFARPQMLAGKEITSATSSKLKLVTEIEKEELDIEAIIAGIQADISVSYRLLRYVNSSEFSFQKKIDSIRQCVALLGFKKIRHWLRLVLYSGMLSNSSNPEVLRMALQRAYFLDSLSTAANLGIKHESLFLVGMFSLLDVILNTPMHTILGGLPLEDDLKATLLGQHAKYSAYISLAEAIENFDFSHAEMFAKEQNIPEDVILESFQQAANMADYLVNIAI